MTISRFLKCGEDSDGWDSNITKAAAVVHILRQRNNVAATLPSREYAETTDGHRRNAAMRWTGDVYEATDGCCSLGWVVYKYTFLRPKGFKHRRAQIVKVCDVLLGRRYVCVVREQLRASINSSFWWPKVFLSHSSTLVKMSIVKSLNLSSRKRLRGSDFLFLKTLQNSKRLSLKFPRCTAFGYNK